MRRPQAEEIPDAPGAYLFRDVHGAVLYVGKAKSLRKRVLSYFGRDLGVRGQTMVDTADTVDAIVTGNEVEALMLEFELIHKHKPRFNIRLRDDKSYPYLALTTTEEWPRATVMRGKRYKGNRYFGPYGHAYAIRQTLDLLLRTFPVRTCANPKFKRHETQGRPCLLFHIERCSGPCVGAVTPDDYARHLEGLADFLSGRSDGLVEGMREDMGRCGVARIRARRPAARPSGSGGTGARATGDRVEAARRLRCDRDRGGRPRSCDGAHVGAQRPGHRRATSIVDKVEEVTTPELIERMVREVYGDDTPPPEVLVQELPEDLGVWIEWLSLRRGSAVGIRPAARWQGSSARDGACQRPRGTDAAPSPQGQ